MGRGLGAPARSIPSLLGWGDAPARTLSPHAPPATSPLADPSVPRQRRSPGRRTCCGGRRGRPAAGSGAGRSPAASSALSSPRGCSTLGAAPAASSLRWGRGEGMGQGTGQGGAEPTLIPPPPASSDRPPRRLRLHRAALQPHRAALREVPTPAAPALDVRAAVHLFQVCPQPCARRVPCPPVPPAHSFVSRQQRRPGRPRHCPAAGGAPG